MPEPKLPESPEWAQVLNDCDPGIRHAVEVLADAGFTTTDSGDGITKLGFGSAFAPEEVIPFPHVAFLATGFKIGRQRAGAAEQWYGPREVARRAQDALRAAEPWRAWTVEVSWSTAEGHDAPWLYLASVVE